MLTGRIVRRYRLNVEEKLSLPHVPHPKVGGGKILGRKYLQIKLFPSYSALYDQDLQYAITMTYSAKTRLVQRPVDAS